MKTALIITTYNRPEYLKRCLESLSQLNEKPDMIHLIDDGSTNQETIGLFWDFNLNLPGYNHAQFPDNKGIKERLMFGFDMWFINRMDVVINLDADAIVSPDFITRLKDLKTRYPGHIVSGFNCNNPQNPIIYDGPDYVLRKHVNGINMCIDKRQYENIVLPALQSEGNWDFNSTHNLPIVISKPSVVQHIGMVSSMGHSVNPDVACDFPS